MSTTPDPELRSAFWRGSRRGLDQFPRTMLRRIAEDHWLFVWCFYLSPVALVAVAAHDALQRLLG